jgi:ABC-type dipeptide/oligopeptide/nickel transport system ATPase component
MSHLLEVKNLQTHFFTRAGVVRSVDGVSFHLDRGRVAGAGGRVGVREERDGAVGDASRRRAGEDRRRGEIWFDGEDLRAASEKRLREIRGDDIAMIFQDPMTSLNPVYTVGEQIAEALRLHRKLSRGQAREGRD